MSDGKHFSNNGSDHYTQTKGESAGNHVTVTPTPDGGHVHVAYDKDTGAITHSDMTLSNGAKIDINPDVASSMSAFFSKDE